MCERFSGRFSKLSVKVQCRWATCVTLNIQRDRARLGENISSVEAVCFYFRIKSK